MLIEQGFQTRKLEAILSSTSRLEPEGGHAAGVPQPPSHPCIPGALNGTGLLGSQSDPLPSSFTPVFFSQLSANHTLVSRCDGVRQCIYDTMATGDIRTGLHTRSLFTAYQRMNATLSMWYPRGATPPTAPVTSTFTPFTHQLPAPNLGVMPSSPSLAGASCPDAAPWPLCPAPLLRCPYLFRVLTPELLW